ncbi:MAG: HD domain-containing phosphohydrolase [Elusimicrobiota bacterium]
MTSPLWLGLIGLVCAGAGYLAAFVRERSLRPALEALFEEKEVRSAETVKRLSAKNQKLELALERIESAFYATMDPIVARMIIDRKIHNEKRHVTIMFADVVDFTSEAEKHPPETVVSTLNQMFTAIDPVFARFRGHIDKYLGDGLMAEFGAPYSAHNHPLLAVLAALRIQQRMVEGKFSWKVRIGIASGPLIVGLIGSERRRAYTAIGDAVNLSSRLQVLCPIGGVCVDEEVYRLVKRWFNVRRIQEGLGAKEVHVLESQLGLLNKAVELAPNSKQCLEAVNICAELGDVERAMHFHQIAARLEPAQQAAFDNALAVAIRACNERAFVTVKGKRERVSAYEIQGLRDIWSDRARLPAKVMHIFRWLETELELPEECILAIEAIEGRLGRAAVTGAISGAVAEQLGLGDAQVRMAFLAGYFCDVGKRDVPEHILCYEGRLLDLPQSDQELLRNHVAQTEKVMEEIGAPTTPELMRAIAHHHERFDGTGYPKGLKDEEISLLGRIVRVADTYEAITAWRPHQDPLTPRAALIEIGRDMNGGGIDPKVGKAFLEMMGGLPSVVP